MKQKRRREKTAKKAETRFVPHYLETQNCRCVPQTKWWCLCWTLKALSASDTYLVWFSGAVGVHADDNSVHDEPTEVQLAISPIYVLDVYTAHDSHTHFGCCCFEFYLSSLFKWTLHGLNSCDPLSPGEPFPALNPAWKSNRDADDTDCMQPSYELQNNNDDWNEKHWARTYLKIEHSICTGCAVPSSMISNWFIRAENFTPNWIKICGHSWYICILILPKLLPANIFD